MFTGIVDDLGEVIGLETRGDLRARIACGYDLDKLAIGASVACAGACLTVVAKGEGWFETDISAETAARTTAGAWAPGDRVNLERALRVGDELGGHIVSGHVDGTGTVVSLAEEGDSTRVEIEAPEELSRFIAPKGSIAVDGASLTVNAVEGARFGVNLIPHTKAVTSFAGLETGARVNLEIDVLARYVARLEEMRT